MYLDRYLGAVLRDSQQKKKNSHFALSRKAVKYMELASAAAAAAVLLHRMRVRLRQSTVMGNKPNLEAHCSVLEGEPLWGQGTNASLCCVD